MTYGTSRDDVERILGEYMARARELGWAAHQLGASGDDLTGILDGALAEAERVIQGRPGGYKAWRSYWNDKWADKCRIHNEIALRGFTVDTRLVTERSTKYEMQFDDAAAYSAANYVPTSWGNYMGLERD